MLGKQELTQLPGDKNRGLHTPRERKFNWESLTDPGKKKEKIHCRVLPGSRETLLGETKRTTQPSLLFKTTLISLPLGNSLEQ